LSAATTPPGLHLVHHQQDPVAVGALTQSLEEAALAVAVRSGHPSGATDVAAALRSVELLQLAIASASARPGGGPGTTTASGLIVPLTAREREVLGKLAEGTSNHAIASDLFVTVDTVKKHVSHILDKLGVGNRTQAVTRARDLGLLP
jgi:LuxR family maltose regulon positive regulatory protein